MRMLMRMLLPPLPFFFLRGAGGGGAHREGGLPAAGNPLPGRDREHQLQGALGHHQESPQRES